jgi:hypothetical protein
VSLQQLLQQQQESEVVTWLQLVVQKGSAILQAQALLQVAAQPRELCLRYYCYCYCYCYC